MEAAEAAQVPLQLFPFVQVKYLHCQGIYLSDSVSLSNNNGIEEWEFPGRIALPSRLYPLTTNRGKANTLLSATHQRFLFGFHFDNGNSEGSWER